MTTDLSSEQIEYIARNWSTLSDTCTDTPTPLVLNWPCEPKSPLCQDVFGEYIGVVKTRELPVYVRAQAVAYIEVLVARYPFQLRQAMANPMWHRFLDVWTDTGKRRLALRAI